MRSTIKPHYVTYHTHHVIQPTYSVSLRLLQELEPQIRSAEVMQIDEQNIIIISHT